MNNRSVLELAGVPSEFSLTKYEACAQFTAADWYCNLSARALRRSTATKHREHFLDELRRGADYFLKNPIAPLREIEEGEGYSKNVFRSQIRDQTALELLSGRTVLDTYGDRAEAYSEAFRINERADDGEADVEGADAAYSTLDVPAWKMMNDIGIAMSGEVAVKVDLFASEDKLMDDFRAWLRVTRQALNVPPIQRRFAATDFERWTQSRILPWLDLTFWADINGQHLTNQILGVVLFPDEYNIGLADRIRKVVAPIALAASSPAYLDALASQALEGAERK